MFLLKPLTISISLWLPFKVAQADLNIKTLDNYQDRSVQNGLTAETLGDLHNTMMLKFHNDLLLNPRLSRREFNQILIEEVKNLCDPSDSECRNSITGEVMETTALVNDFLQSGDDFNIRSIIPESLGSELIDCFVKIYESAKHLGEGNLRRFLWELDRVSRKAERDAGLNKAKKTIVEAVVSIAKSSGQFWTEVDQNPSSVINVRKDEHRHLQTFVDLTDFGINATFDIQKATQADILGGIQGAFPTLVSMVTFIFSSDNIMTLAPNLIRGAVEASATALGGFVIIPTITDFAECFLIELFPQAILNIPIIGPAFLSFVSDGCSTTTLFGTDLAPVIDFLFPFFANLINDGD